MAASSGQSGAWRKGRFRIRAAPAVPFPPAGGRAALAAQLYGARCRKRARLYGAPPRARADALVRRFLGRAGRSAPLSGAAGGMSDSEEYSSAEDADYVPSGGEYSEDDVSELVKEDEDEEKPQKEKGKKNSKGPACRKRKRGGILLVPGGREESQDQQSDSEEEEEADSLRQVKGGRAEEEEEKKKKEDALWASFLSDVGQKSKAPAATQVPGPQANKTAEVKNSSRFQADVKEPEKPKDVAKVTITKVFDFAGEEVRVTKEVDAASKEAKSFLKQQEKETQPATPASLPTVSGVKRPSGMSSLLGKLGSKKQKMSTLEKSKLDWESFKEEEGIGEELAIHNRGKDGYVDRKAFLERVDHRQFEIERDIRMSKMKP